MINGPQPGIMKALP